MVQFFWPTVYVRTKWRATKSALKSLSHGKITAVSEWSLNQLLLHAKIFEAVVELGICHVDTQLLQNISVLRIKVETHLCQPVERLRVGDAILHKHPSDVSLMH